MEEKGLASSKKFSQWTDQTRHTRLKVTARHSVVEGTPGGRGHQPAVSQSGCSSVNCERRDHQGQSLSHCAGVTSSAHTQLYSQGPSPAPHACITNTWPTEPSSKPSTEGRMETGSTCPGTFPGITAGRALMMLKGKQMA